MEPENQVSASSNKITYIVIGVVAILLIGWFLMGRLGASVTGVDVDRSADGSATYSNDEGSVTVGGNTLPDNWPSDAPTYPNANIQFSGSSNPQTGEQGTAIVFMTTDSMQSVVDFYKRELNNKGWTIEQTATMGASTILAAEKDTRAFGIYVTDAGSGQVSVTVSITTP